MHTCTVGPDMTLALVDDAAVGVHMHQGAMRIHAGCQGGGEQAEALGASQQAVQVVVEVVVQAGGGARTGGAHPQVHTLGHELAHQRGLQGKVPTQ
jgi:hypothetical protein